MKPFTILCWQGARWCGSCALSLAIWTLWLLLSLLLVAQVWCLCTRELAVPDFLLRALEARLAASQLHATFGRTVFDPSGQIVIENTTLSTPAFNEPLVTAAVIYVQLDPWALLAGRFDPREVRASGVDFYVPAMLSATGRAEPVVRDIDTTFLPRDNEIEIRQLTARLGGLALSIRGTIHVATGPRERGAPLPIADFIAREYPLLSREAAGYLSRLDQLDEPSLRLDLTPSDTRGAIVNATLLARGLRLTPPLSAQAVNIVATTRFPLSGDASVKAQVEVAADEVRLPDHTVARGVQARMRGLLRPAQPDFDPEEADVSASGVSSPYLAAAIAPFSVSVQVQAAVLRGTLITRVADAPLAVTGETDLAQKTAGLDFEGRLTNALLVPLGPLAQHDLTALLQLSAPVELNGHVRLNAGWTFAGLDTRVAAQGLTAHGVRVDAFQARVHFAGTTLQATDIVLLQGGNFATGSYTMDTTTLDCRYLLTGRLRPLDINGWFSGVWWPRLFSNFDFTAGAPEADIDVQGRYGSPLVWTEFMAVSARAPAIRGVPFDLVRGVLFIRSDLIAAPELLLTHGAGAARGSFTRNFDPAASAFREMDFAVTSTLDVTECARLFGQSGLDMVAPFQFGTPPLLRINGHLDGPDAPGGAHETVHIEGESTGAFALYAFPLDNLSFRADLHDDDLVLDRIKLDFAGGTGTGRAHLQGRGDAQQLDLDYTLKGANLARAIAAVADYSARNNRAGAPGKSAFLEKAAEVRVDLAVAATGLFKDPFSYHGAGHAELDGPELGEVRLLGGLSTVLNFTALRFTTMRTSFKVDGAQLVFPDVKITGANSAITARGIYFLDRHQLDFTAKVAPFGESKFILQNLMGLVLSPLTKVFEVRLGGTLEKPSWIPVPSILSPNPLHNAATTPAPESAKPVSAGEPLSPYLKR